MQGLVAVAVLARLSLPTAGPDCGPLRLAVPLPAEVSAQPRQTDVVAARRFLIQGWPAPDLAVVPEAFTTIRDSLANRAASTLYWLMAHDTSEEMASDLSPDSDDVAERAGVTYAALGFSPGPVMRLLVSTQAEANWRLARAAFDALSSLDSGRVNPARKEFLCRLARRVLSSDRPDPSDTRLLRYVMQTLRSEALHGEIAAALLRWPTIKRAGELISER
jgi:hypothetical protein